MTTVDEIEAAVTRLCPDDLQELMRRLRPFSEDGDEGEVDEHGNDAWDRQMIADAAAGKFDQLIAAAKADAAAGRTRDLP